KSLTQSLPGMAVLLIITYRPAYQQPFGDRTYHWRIGLQPVDEHDAACIVRATLGVAELPRELAVTIAGKAEGNPFFLEEIGRTLAETGAVRTENGRLILAQAVSAISVPDTVQDVIAARLDRLAEPQKRTVQTASARAPRSSPTISRAARSGTRSSGTHARPASAPRTSSSTTRPSSSMRSRWRRSDICRRSARRRARASTCGSPCARPSGGADSPSAWL